MLPADHLWPIDSEWNYHCARGEFGQMKRYLNAFTNRYGAVASVEEFAFKSQAANYEAMRPMYEAFAANLPRTTGIIQWMLNPSWPKLYWQLYDYYLVPGGAFFGAKRGAAPLAIIYNYGDRGVYLVNQTAGAAGELRTALTVYDLNSRIILATNLATPCPAYGSKKILDLSSLAPETPVYFLELTTQTRPANVRGKFLLALHQARRVGRSQEPVVRHAQPNRSPTSPRSTSCRRPPWTPKWISNRRPASQRGPSSH